MITFAGYWQRRGDDSSASTMARRMLDATPGRRSLVGGWTSGGLCVAVRDDQLGPEVTPSVRRLGDLLIVGYVRIDNRDELSRRLDQPLPDDDYDLVLALYRRYGTNSAAMLTGDFAFALYDSAEKRIFAARDQIGVRSFYYHASNDTFAFATSSHGLRSLPELPTRVDELRVADYLISLYEDPAATFFQGIRRLPAAHWMMVTPGELVIKRYWGLDECSERKGGEDPAELVEEFRSIFVRAVRDRTLGEEGVISSTLSGGLDSSSVAGVARDLILSDTSTRSLHVHSALFDTVRESDEREFIDAVVAQGGMVPHIVEGDRIGPLNELDTLLAEQGEPFFAPNLFVHRALMRSASQAGASVMLDGLDGDTTVSHGLAWLPELARRGRLLQLRREIGGIAELDRGRRPRDIWYRSIVRPLLLRSPRQLFHRMRGPVDPPWGEDSPISEDLVRRFRLRERYLELAGSRARPARRHHEDHRRRIEWSLHPFMLEVLQRSGASFGIESRYPFYDRRLIEYSLSLPPGTKLHNGWTRWILRQSMNGTLPEVVRWRPDKSNLGHNFERSLRIYESERINALLDAPGRLAEFADVALLRRMFTRFAAEKATSAEILAIWKGVTLGLWLECFEER